MSPSRRPSAPSVSAKFSIFPAVSAPMSADDEPASSPTTIWPPEIAEPPISTRRACVMGASQTKLCSHPMDSPIHTSPSFGYSRSQGSGGGTRICKSAAFSGGSGTRSSRIRVASCASSGCSPFVR
jgi:hypothetical protein